MDFVPNGSYEAYSVEIGLPAKLNGSHRRYSTKTVKPGVKSANKLTTIR